MSFTTTLRTLGRRLGTRFNRAMGMRERVGAGAAALAVAMAAGWGLWSCQTSPTAMRTSSIPEIPSSEPEVRVRIRAAAATVKLSGPDEFLVRAGVGESRTFSGPLTIMATDDGCRITDGHGSMSNVANVPAVDVEAAAKGSIAGEVQKIKVEGTPYAGRVRVLMRAGSPVASADLPLPGGVLASFTRVSFDGPAPDGASHTPPTARGVSGARAGGGAAPKFDVVEVVPVESYLSGVIVSEMPKQWPLGAFEVQAVCARTYALHERQRALKAGRAWDLEAGEIDQAYNGGIEVPTAMKAVAQTRGVVLTTDGHLVRAYYSSTCGGRTAGASSIWPTGPGFEFNLDKPIQANARESACQASPVYRWTITRDRNDLSKQIREWGKVNGQPVAKMSLIQSLEVAQANSVGRPTKYTITDDEGATFPIAAELLRVACNYGIPGIKPITKESRVRSGDLEMEVTSSGIVIRGRGFGHGVGMCQYCAKAMAERGDAWQDMLARFYPGAKLERAY